jgi:hypothetical protein
VGVTGVKGASPRPAQAIVLAKLNPVGTTISRRSDYDSRSRVYNPIAIRTAKAVREIHRLEMEVLSVVKSRRESPAATKSGPLCLFVHIWKTHRSAGKIAGAVSYVVARTRWDWLVSEKAAEFMSVGRCYAKHCG